MSVEENRILQDEEIEAVSSIYGEDWSVIDAGSHKYCIKITDEKCPNFVSLQITLPCDYPKSSPPEYTLSAPWLRGEERFQIDDALADIYCENIGESIIFLWVEKIRELLQEKSGERNLATEIVGAVDEIRSEEAHGDDEMEDFDVIQQQLATSCSLIPDETEHELKCPTIYHGESFLDRKSVFQGHIAEITHKNQVKMVLESLCESKKIATATHNIYAYRIAQSDNSDVFYQGCEDDGETQAGSRMLHLMQIVDARNVIVVVTRWYGGVHLGPDRFKHINNITRQLLDEHGYIKTKDEKKGPKSSKKKR